MQTLTDDIDYLQFLGTQESQYIEPASKFVDEVLARLSGDVGVRGDVMPWSKTQNCIAFRPGEVSIWGGFNGHRKSMVLNQVCAWGLKEKNWLIASLEMKPSATMARMVKQVAGTSNPSDEFVRKFSNWTDNRLWIYDQYDTVKAERILGMVHYAAQELQINHVIIDSLMKCGIPKDDLEQQARFVDRLCWAAKSENIHVHLVHHMRKGEGNAGEMSPPGKHDFRGAGEVVDLVDNAIVVHSNKRKEQKEEQGLDVDPDEPDAQLIVVKQRHGEWEGKFKFWINKTCMQFTPTKDKRVMPYREDV